MNYKKYPTFTKYDAVRLLLNNKLIFSILPCVNLLLCFGSKQIDIPVSVYMISILLLVFCLLNFIFACVFAFNNNKVSFQISDSYICLNNDSSQMFIPEDIILVITKAAVADLGHNSHRMFINGLLSGQYMISIIIIKGSCEETIKNIYTRAYLYRARESSRFGWDKLDSEEVYDIIPPDLLLFQCCFNVDILELLLSISNCSLIASDKDIVQLNIDTSRFVAVFHDDWNIF